VLDPDLTHLGLLDCVEKSALILFEAAPDLPERSVVNWPHPADHLGFVDTAVRAGATILYVERFELNDDRIGREALRLGEDHKLLDEFRSHDGETIYVMAMWILHGVGHALTVFADWFIDLDQRLDTAAVAVADQESAGRRAKRSELIVELANLPAFATAKNDAARSLVIDGHMEGLLQVMGGSTFVQEVKDYFNVNVLPGLEAAMAAQARELLAAKKPKKEVAATLGIGTTRLEQLLVRHPEG
jgi:hypothetical protein